MPEEKTPQQVADSKAGSVVRSAVAEELGLDKIDFVKEALRWQYNWIGLAGAAAFALISGTGLPLVLVAGLELIYLSVVPQSSRFRRLVRSWKYAEEKRRRELKLSAVFDELPSEMRKRYVTLEARCREIKANYDRLSSTSQMFLGQMEERLQGLLHAYLRLLGSAQQQGKYLVAIDPSQIREEVDQLQQSVQSQAANPKVQEINCKRVEILTKRLEKHKKISENRQVVEAQCKAIEDVLALIRDQSVTVQDPQEVSSQLDSLLEDVQQTEETIREVESIFELAAPEFASLPPMPSGSAADNVSPAGRSRQRT